MSNYSEDFVKGADSVWNMLKDIQRLPNTQRYEFTDGTSLAKYMYLTDAIPCLEKFIEFKKRNYALRLGDVVKWYDGYIMRRGIYLGDIDETSALVWFETCEESTVVNKLSLYHIDMHFDINEFFKTKDTEF